MAKNKSDLGNFFEDFKIGHVFQCPTPRTLTLGDNAAYLALTGDRTPRFCDARNEVHPLTVFHLVLGQTVRQISLNARANLGYAGLVWLRPVFSGDTLRTTAEIIGLKENSNKKTGIAYVETQAKNQKGEDVMRYVRWVMVKKRDIEKATDYLENPKIPELPSVSMKVLPTGSFQVVKDAIPNKDLTDGEFFFKDYEKGERIAHIDGMTVNPSDHMAFTRLFQNTAKVHFDAMLTDGKPLVYGGYPISIGYAQAFNGFQNRTGIFAINSGAHANPVYAGDTLYSFTEVLDQHEFGPNERVGALRLRLVVVKNDSLKDVQDFPIMVDNPKRPGKKMHHPKVVLDLDFWEQMATGL